MFFYIIELGQQMGKAEEKGSAMKGIFRRRHNDAEWRMEMVLASSVRNGLSER